MSFKSPNRTVTPLRQQYLAIKANYPDAIVFFRLGDFYETFDQDAEIAAKELDLVLTGRPISRDERVPMAGVPHHAVDTYIERLVTKGYSVAVVEQIGDALQKGVIERQVTRVITPEVQNDDQALEEQYDPHHPSDDVVFSEPVLKGLIAAVNGALESRAVLEYRLDTDRGRIFIKTPCLRVEGGEVIATIPLLGEAVLVDHCLRRLLREEALVDWALEQNEESADVQPEGYMRPCERCDGFGSIANGDLVTPCPVCDGTGIHINEDDE